MRLRSCTKHVQMGLTILCLTACRATIPAEVVQLSQTVGQDIVALQTSYHTLVNEHFDNLRRERARFIDAEWRPVFLERYADGTKLRELVATSTPGDLPQVLSIWAEVALDTINARRDALIGPLNRDQANLLKLVDEAFANLLWANATITMHLNSIQKVQQVQDQALAALKLKVLRDSIDARFAKASASADSVLEVFKRTEGLFKKASKEQ